MRSTSVAKSSTRRQSASIYVINIVSVWLVTFTLKGPSELASQMDRRVSTHLFISLSLSVNRDNKPSMMV